VTFQKFIAFRSRPSRQTRIDTPKSLLPIQLCLGADIARIPISYLPCVVKYTSERIQSNHILVLCGTSSCASFNILRTTCASILYVAGSSAVRHQGTRAPTTWTSPHTSHLSLKADMDVTSKTWETTMHSHTWRFPELWQQADVSLASQKATASEHLEALLLRGGVRIDYAISINRGIQLEAASPSRSPESQ
jgi:hypothetical protein